MLVFEDLVAFLENLVIVVGVESKVEEKKKQQKTASATELMDQITELEKQMFEYARELEFEKAASLRDDIEALRKQVVTLS